MELREWLIILGLALVTLIVIDGVRRLKRQRRVPRLDQVGDDTGLGGSADPDAAGDANWELPNGGARVVSPASKSTVRPKPKLERQDHPGPSRVLSGLKRQTASSSSAQPSTATAQASQHAAPGEFAEPQPEVRAAPSGTRSPSPSPAGESDTRHTPPAEPSMTARSAAAPETAKAPETPSDREPYRASAAPEGETSVPDDAVGEPAGQHRREPTLSALEEEAPLASPAEPLTAHADDHDAAHDDDERYRLVDLDGMGDSLKSGSRRMGASVQRFGASVQQRLASRRERKREAREREMAEKAREAERVAAQRAENTAKEQREADERRLAARRQRDAEASAMAEEADPLFAPSREREAAPTTAWRETEALADSEQGDMAASRSDDDVVRAHPTLEKALRHDVSAEQARHALSHAEEIIVISVMSRDDAGFSGAALLDLMLACGLRYSSEMGIFHRFETEDADSHLQFSMVNVIKPGTFPIEAMDDFTTPGITLLMPLPGAVDTAAAFEAMVETAMVIVRHLGGELKDENHSVMTAQTVEFARQRVQEFERRNRLNRCLVN